MALEDLLPIGSKERSIVKDGSHPVLESSMEEPQRRWYDAPIEWMKEAGRAAGVSARETLKAAVPFSGAMPIEGLRKEGYSGKDVFLDVLKVGAIAGFIGETYFATHTPDLPSVYDNAVAYADRLWLLYGGLTLLHAYQGIRENYGKLKGFLDGIVSKGDDASKGEKMVRWIDNALTDTNSLAVLPLALEFDSVNRMFDMHYFEFFRNWEETHLYGPTLPQHVAVIYPMARVTRNRIKDGLKEAGLYDSSQGIDPKYEAGIFAISLMAGMTVAWGWEQHEAGDPNFTCLPLDTVADYIWGGLGALMGASSTERIPGLVQGVMDGIRSDMGYSGQLHAKDYTIHRNPADRM